LNGHFGRLALAAVFSFTLTHQAPAETTAVTARNWGLIGRWSVDCSLPISRDKNPLLAYEIVGGERVVHRRNFDDGTDENPVVGAEVSSDGILNLRVFFPKLKQTREYGLLMQSDGAMQTTYNRDLNEQYTVKDSKFTANGNPTPSLRKCK
jgi:hypothetical protein